MSNLSDTLGAMCQTGDQLPWSNATLIHYFERQAAGIFSNESEREDIHMKLLWALVHSRQPADVQRGIAMLNAALDIAQEQLERREVLYLIAVGHFRAKDYGNARVFIDLALEIPPEFTQGVTLKMMIEDKIAKDGTSGFGLVTAALGIITSGIVAALVKWR